ncbi:hypothetical protein [Microbacterium sp. Marseille-Q6965]|uniref:hypothetical protein n=1 Tax=Microbacterium sp. Marseille-Q6965 TaxID=2965072 RepID=UPI0021B7E516|nr:hypothetical protein [Microbacterium sp. Marseille-Q6965]
MRLTATADDRLWVSVTGSVGLRGRRHRKAAIRMLLNISRRQLGLETPSGRFGPWLMSQFVPMIMRRMEGRILAWVWREDPELLVAMAQVEELTPQLRAARAMMPMQYDDAEPFHSPHLGAGERLVLDMPQRENTPPMATYSWETGTHLVTLTAMSPDRTRFGTVLGAVDELARSLRLVDDVQLGESNVLRLDPA